MSSPCAELVGLWDAHDPFDYAAVLRYDGRSV
jgi:hypothetical protein